jgi:hypothetical protein
MPDTAANGGGTSTDTQNNGGGSRSGPTDEGRGVARRLLQKFRGKAEDALAQLADENRALRDDRRDLTAKLKGFEGTDVLVLRGDDLKRYTELKTIVGDKKPDDVKKELDELGTLRTKVQAGERRTSAAAAVRDHIKDWKNPDAFAEMVIDKGLEVSLVDSQDKDGKAIKVPHVKPANDPKATAVSAVDWVKNNASYMLPALTAGATSSTQQTGTQQTTQRGGTQFVEQGQTGSTAAAGGEQKTNAAAIPGRRPYVLPSQRNAAAGGDKK